MERRAFSSSVFFEERRLLETRTQHEAADDRALVQYRARAIDSSSQGEDLRYQKRKVDAQRLEQASKEVRKTGVVPHWVPAHERKDRWDNFDPTAYEEQLKEDSKRGKKLEKGFLRATKASRTH
jgi:hypothetical protein